MLTNQIIEHFNIEGQIIEICPLSGGNINNTYLLKMDLDDKITSFVVQKVNKSVFNQPHLIGQNIQLVETHLCKHDYKYDTLNLIPTKNNKLGFWETEQIYWRIFRFIESSISLSSIQTTEMAFDVANAFGYFTDCIQTIPSKQIYTAIPDFHNLKKRMVDFKKAIENDAVQRLKWCQKEVNWLRNNVDLVEQFTDLNLPPRLVHGDAKIGNVLFDKNTKKVKAIIDWDTIMPSSILFDFGDLVRSMACSHDENEQDLSKIYFKIDYLLAIQSGFYEHWANCLVKEERNHLSLSAKVLIIIQAIRFLTDFLNGDVYYQIQYETHNWRRAQNQIALAQSLIEQIPK